MVNDGTKVKASSRLVKDEESKVHSSKRAKCGCQTETFMVIMQCTCCQESCDNWRVLNVKTSWKGNLCTNRMIFMSYKIFLKRLLDIEFIHSTLWNTPKWNSTYHYSLGITLTVECVSFNLQPHIPKVHA
jgi:hypothetical protein